MTAVRLQSERLHSPTTLLLMTTVQRFDLKFPRTAVSAAILLVAQLIQATSVHADGYSVLHSFDGTDGDFPIAGLALVGSTLYGTTANGGASNLGALFSMNLDGSGFQVIHSFDNSGAAPYGGLTLVGSQLYGTTSSTSSSGIGGTVFSVNLDGSMFQNISTLNGSAQAGLTLVGSRLFGTTYNGGDHNFGSVFSVKLDGSDLQYLHSFSIEDSDGFSPTAGLTFDGARLYGTTSQTGIEFLGTVFSIKPDGSEFITLHNFQGTDGAAPDGELTLIGSTLFGTTTGGLLASGNGTAFSMNIDGAGFQTLHQFYDPTDFFLGPYTGVTPVGEKLYGTTDGTIYSMNPDGTAFQNMHLFKSDGSDGFAWPMGEMLLVGSTLYGTTTMGGAFGHGTVFALTVPEPNTAAIAGTLAAILGLTRLRKKRR